jgi:gamma-glutamyl hercynylcysteine S-oxide synthase
MNAMKLGRDRLRLATIVLFCLINIGFGLYAWQMPLLLGGAVGMVYVTVAIAMGAYQPAESAEARQPEAMSVTAVNPTGKSHDSATPFRRMLTQSRHAVLLRKQVAGGLSASQFREVYQQLQARMGLVPEGDVVLCKSNPQLEDEAADPLAPQERRVHVPPLFLDRYTMTNRQYYEFVAAGGYSEIANWDPQLWPAVGEFIDRTGHPGPAFWREGCYLPGEEDLPVVGVCWYEAQACARWLGKRLPTDAEWVKAACWPMAAEGTALTQRRFPWGDRMDHSRANLWGSGANHIVAVTEFPEGVSVGGIFQLVGNVWQWSASDFRLSPNEFSSGGPLKSIRGGAFDTYFDNQATCQFESGEYPLNRRHNIGFRCAISVCDLVQPLPNGEREDMSRAGSLPQREVMHV